MSVCSVAGGVFSTVVQGLGSQVTLSLEIINSRNISSRCSPIIFFFVSASQHTWFLRDSQEADVSNTAFFFFFICLRGFNICDCTITNGIVQAPKIKNKQMKKHENKVLIKMKILVGWGKCCCMTLYFQCKYSINTLSFNYCFESWQKKAVVKYSQMEFSTQMNVYPIQECCLQFLINLQPKYILCSSTITVMFLEMTEQRSLL